MKQNHRTPVILSAANVILSAANVILSAAKNLARAVIRPRFFAALRMTECAKFFAALRMTVCGGTQQPLPIALP